MLGLSVRHTSGTDYSCLLYSILVAARVLPAAAQSHHDVVDMVRQIRYVLHNAMQSIAGPDKKYDTGHWDFGMTPARDKVIEETKDFLCESHIHILCNAMKKDIVVLGPESSVGLEIVHYKPGWEAASSLRTRAPSELAQLAVGVKECRSIWLVNPTNLHFEVHI